MNGNAKLERSEPKRWLTKKDGVRHITHAAIRLVIAEEDPFATNVLVQSAEKVLIDLLRRSQLDDPFSFERFIKPEYKKAFFEMYREPYNFLKHADRDHDGKLPVHGIVGWNDVFLLGCIIRYEKLFGQLTTHMQSFLTLCFVCYPHLISWPDVPGAAVPTKSLSSLGRQSRAELLATMRLALEQDSQFQTEKRYDLSDVSEAGATRARRVTG
jgi:hypothetical protein